MTSPTSWKSSGGNGVVDRDMTDLVGAGASGSVRWYQSQTRKRWPPRVAMPLFFVSALSILALILRAMVADNGGLWRDEALFLAIVQAPSWGEMIDFLRYHESHPPLFYAMMRVWISIAGDSDAATRQLPILLGVAMIPAIYVAGRSLFSRHVGLLAAALASISPALTEYSAIVRPYSLLPLLALASSWTLIRGLERGGRWIWAGHAASTLALVYTHNWSWLIVAGQAVAAAIVISRALPAERGVRVREWVVTQLTIAAGYSLWIPSFLNQAVDAGHAPFALAGPIDMVVFAILGIKEFLTSTVLVDPLDLSLSSIAVLPAIIAIGLAGVRLSGRRLRDHSRPAPRTDAAKETRNGSHRRIPIATTVLLLTPAIACALAIALSPHSMMLVSRCMASLAPAVLLSVSFWLTCLRGRAIALLTAPILGVLLVTYVIGLARLSTSLRSNARELAAAFGPATRPSDLVIVAPGYLASSVNRYYHSSAAQIAYPDFGRKETFNYSRMRDRASDPSAYARIQRCIADARRKNARVWLIMDKEDLRAFTPDDVDEALRSRNYGRIMNARANQLRAELELTYGRPVQTIEAGVAHAPFENLFAILFAAEGEVGKKSRRPD